MGYLAISGLFMWLAYFSTPSLTGLLIALTIFGMGIPLIFIPSYSTAISSVPPTKTGVAMGMILTLRYLGGSLGLGLVRGLFIKRFVFCSVQLFNLIMVYDSPNKKAYAKNARHNQWHSKKESRKKSCKWIT